MSSADSSDDSICSNDNFQYWNDWQKQDDHISFNNELKKEKSSFSLDISNIGREKKIRNWIPPTFIFETNKPKNFNSKKLVSDRKKSKTDIFEKNKTINCNEKNLDKAIMCKTPSEFNSFEVEKLLNIKWGNRIELNDVMDYMDNNLIWGVVNLGFFVIINLWANEYGNICGLAEGTISKVGFSGMSKISITNIHLLQKMLGLSHSQWTSLCEMVQQNRENLKFNALNPVYLEKMTSLEKLWYFICRRRHFLPDQCMLLKFSGVVKSLKEFNITPKLTVQDIRNIQTEDDIN